MQGAIPRDVSGRGLRLLNVASSIAPSAGGISESILQMSRALIDLGHAVETVTVDDPNSPWASDVPPSVHLKGPPRGKLEYSRDFQRWLEENAARFDAVIAHGLWRYNSQATRRAAKSAGRAYFVFPHGMLDPWFKRTYPLKHLQKCVYWWLGERAVLRDAAAVLFTCREEMALARESFRPYSCVERVVPLGTSEPPQNIDEQRQAFAASFPALAGRRVLLFLGRLHEKKGCNLLLSAFLRLLQSQPREMWQNLHLMLAGPCSHPEYLRSLQQIAAECDKLSPGSVSFPGMLTGDLKWGVLRAAEVFVLPSHQENFGVAVVEALACGTPVLISRAVNIWREIESSGAGFVDEDTEAGCSRLLERWLALMPTERSAMSAQATECFRQKFEITQTATSLVDTIREFLTAATSELPRAPAAA